MVLGLLSLRPLVSTSCLGSELPHKETQVLLPETVDTWGDTPWRMRDHRERKSPHRGKPWHSSGQQASKSQTCKRGRIGSPRFNSAVQLKPCPSSMRYLCSVLPKLLFCGTMSKIAVVQPSNLGWYSTQKQIYNTSGNMVTATFSEKNPRGKPCCHLGGIRELN